MASFCGRTCKCLPKPRGRDLDVGVVRRAGWASNAVRAKRPGKGEGGGMQWASVQAVLSSTFRLLHSICSEQRSRAGGLTQTRPSRRCRSLCVCAPSSLVLPPRRFSCAFLARLDPARPRSPFARPLMMPDVGVVCLSRIAAAAEAGYPPVCPHGCSRFPQRGLGMTLLRTTLLPSPECPCYLNAVTRAEVIILACQLAAQPMTVSPHPLV